MATRVQIAFDLAANGVGSYFTLDDPVKGVLDNATYKLAGDVLVDVTSSVRSISTKRGRSRQLDRFVAGSSNLVIDNRNSYFDPTNTSSPYYGSVVPGKQITIDRDGVDIYVGNVADWNFEYDLNGDATALPSCTDGFAYMATQILTAGSATAQLTGARINSVLTAINWPTAQRSIATGQATLDGDFVPDGTNALAYLQKVGDYSEPGAFFISSDGLATFKDRAQLQAYTSGIEFGTGSGAIPYVDFAVVYGIEEMTNAIEVTYTAGTVTAGTAIASSAASQAKYGVLDSKVDTVLGSLADAQALADWQVSLYSEPQYRVDSITVNLDSLSAAQIASILAIDLGDAVSVTPPNGSVAQIVSIDGIEHNATPQQHLVTFTMSETLAAFILDSSIFGILDTSVLGF
jgi:hypothetical protein